MPYLLWLLFIKNKSRHVKTKRHIQALNNKKMINNRFTYSVEPIQNNNHIVSDVDSSVENQSKLDVSVETEINIIEDRFSPDFPLRGKSAKADSKFYQQNNNNNIDSSKN